jgi:hypothetical protein
LDYEEILDHLDDEGETPEPERMPSFGIKTTLFLQNAEEWLFIWSAVLPMFLVAMTGISQELKRQAK